MKSSRGSALAAFAWPMWRRSGEQSVSAAPPINSVNHKETGND
jgi:hypothetical protein